MRRLSYNVNAITNLGMGEGYEEILRIKDEVDRVVEHMKAGIYKEEKEDSKEVSTKAASECNWCVWL